MKLIVIPVILALSAFLGVRVQQSNTVEENQAEYSDYARIGPLSFHYVIFHSRVISTDSNDPNSGTKNIHILLDEDAFSRENLESLFKSLSRGLAKQEELNVFVLTNIKQVNLEGLFVSKTSTPAEYFNHHRAFYHRDSKNEYYRYTEMPWDYNLKTHLIKGEANKL